MNPFSDYLDCERLRSVLEGSRGKGVKIGVLDTGVDSDHAHFGGCVRACYDVVHLGDGEFRTEEVDRGVDTVGHGTACAGIIHDLAPEAELYSVRVIGSGLGDCSDKLLEGLRFAVEQDWPVLNLSLGTAQFSRPLLRLVEDAYYDGKILITSKDNQMANVGYPAAFSAVLAVDLEHFESPLAFRYRYGEPVEIEAKGVYLNAPNPGGGYQLYTGTSFACSQVTAIAARLVEGIAGLTPFQLRTIIAALSVHERSPSLTPPRDADRGAIQVPKIV